MATMLASHLEQITLSARSIRELEFPPPKIFTNALLQDHEITTLIRDTEPHERALFSLDPDAVSKKNRKSLFPAADIEHSTRKSMFPGPQPVKQSAITRLLGTEMLQEIRQSSANTARSRDAVNLEVLLRGAERLNEVYTVPGVAEKILALRNRYQELIASIRTYEEMVSNQQSLLDRRNKSHDNNGDEDDDKDGGNEGLLAPGANVIYTEADFQNEENEIRDLENRKKALEDRVSGLERDLGGLLR